MILMNFIRHGDVDIRRVEKLPKSAKPTETKTVAYGEVTGHHHTFNGQVLVYEPNGETIQIDGESLQVQKYVEVKETSILEHQEHDSVKISPGIYAILQEREYNPFDQEIRRVMD